MDTRCQGRCAPLAHGSLGSSTPPPFFLLLQGIQRTSRLLLLSPQHPLACSPSWPSSRWGQGYHPSHQPSNHSHSSHFTQIEVFEGHRLQKEHKRHSSNRFAPGSEKDGTVQDPSLEGSQNLDSPQLAFTETRATPGILGAGPGAAAAPGLLLEMQILRLHPRL